MPVPATEVVWEVSEAKKRAYAEKRARNAALHAKILARDTTWTKLRYEPNCIPRITAAKAAGYEFPIDMVIDGRGSSLPPFCGACPQERFHLAREFDVLYGGAAGGGKTKALLMEGIRKASKYAGLRVGAFRRTYPELEESILAELAEIGYAAAIGCRYNETKHDLLFPNRSRIMFRYAETAKDASRRQGGQYQLLLFDERTQTPPEVVNFLYTRLRSGRSALPVIGARSGTNPGGVGHVEVKTRYIDATDHGAKVVVDERNREVVFIPSRIADNPHLNPEYESDLMLLPAAMRAALKDGSWESFVGQVFDEWRHERHVVPRFALPAEWTRYAGIDYGYAAPWCTLWAAHDSDSRLWVYRELYERKVGERQQARKILEAERGGGDPAAVRAADPSMWAKAGDALPVADSYALEGCGLIRANNDRLSGWARLHTYLGDGPACAHHREAGWDTCPMLHVLDGTAPNLVRTLPSAPYDPKRVEDVDTTYEDHALDALRYLVMSIGTAPEVVFSDEPAGDTRALDGSELMVDAGGGIAFGSNWARTR